MQEITIELIPADAPRHTQERCRIIVRQPDGDQAFHTIAGAPGEETLARWLEAGEQPVAFNPHERLGESGYVISFRNGNDEEVHAVTFRLALYDGVPLCDFWNSK